ncbi:MAG: hypothetical protein B6D61_02660 [Bacteroidetes bacterium 4484_249]|nr:MAG: hypothetical protein B6D61_02660 [Bacteroidetes bacterium 4484_249]
MKKIMATIKLSVKPAIYILLYVVMLFLLIKLISGSTIIKNKTLEKAKKEIVTNNNENSLSNEGK